MSQAKNQDLFLVWIFYSMEIQFSNLEKIRKRGPNPQMSDAEIITIEIFGEYLGFNQDIQIYNYIQKHYSAWFPQLPNRWNFTRQCRKLKNIKEILMNRIFNRNSDFVIFDGLPVPLMELVRSYRDKCFKDIAKKSYCASKDIYYYGVKLGVVQNSFGEICCFEVFQANIDERKMLKELFEDGFGSKNKIKTILADKGLISSSLKQDFKELNIELITPSRKNMEQEYNEFEMRYFMKIRRKIETTFSVLCEKFNINNIKVFNKESLFNRILRKIMTYNLTLRFKMLEN